MRGLLYYKIIITHLLFAINFVPSTINAMDNRNHLDGVPLDNYYQPLQVLASLALTLQTLSIFQRVFPPKEYSSSGIYFVLDGASLVFNIVTFGILLTFIKKIISARNIQERV